MKHRGMKTWENKKGIYYLGFDLWEWGAPISINIDVEWCEVHLLCFFFAAGRS